MKTNTLNTTREIMCLLGFSTVKAVMDLAKKHDIKPKCLKNPNKKLSGFLWDKDDFKPIQIQRQKRYEKAATENSGLAKQVLKDLHAGIVPPNELALIRKYGLTRYSAGLVMRRYEHEVMLAKIHNAANGSDTGKEVAA